MTALALLMDRALGVALAAAAGGVVFTILVELSSRLANLPRTGGPPVVGGGRARGMPALHWALFGTLVLFAILYTVASARGALAW